MTLIYVIERLLQFFAMLKRYLVHKKKDDTTKATKQVTIMKDLVASLIDQLYRKYLPAGTQIRGIDKIKTEKDIELPEAITKNTKGTMHFHLPEGMTYNKWRQEFVELGFTNAQAIAAYNAYVLNQEYKSPLDVAIYILELEKIALEHAVRVEQMTKEQKREAFENAVTTQAHTSRSQLVKDIKTNAAAIRKWLADNPDAIKQVDKEVSRKATEATNAEFVIDEEIRKATRAAIEANRLAMEADKFARGVIEKTHKVSADTAFDRNEWFDGYRAQLRSKYGISADKYAAALAYFHHVKNSDAYMRPEKAADADVKAGLYKGKEESKPAGAASAKAHDVMAGIPEEDAVAVMEETAKPTKSDWMKAYQELMKEQGYVVTKKQAKDAYKMYAEGDDWVSASYASLEDARKLENERKTKWVAAYKDLLASEKKKVTDDQADSAYEKYVKDKPADDITSPSNAVGIDKEGYPDIAGEGLKKRRKARSRFSYFLK